MLHDAIQETAHMRQALAAMSFQEVDQGLVSNCTSLEELRMNVEGYFVHSLSRLDPDAADWQAVVEKLRARMAEASNFAEVIQAAHDVFVTVYEEKVNWFARHEVRAFYPEVDYKHDVIKSSDEVNLEVNMG